MNAADAARILSRLFMFVLATALPAMAATPLPDGRLRRLTEDALTVTLHGTHYSSISHAELAAAEAYAAAIYRFAGIETVWTETPWAPGETRLPHLRVVILSPEMTAKKCRGAQLGANLMGTAIDGASDGSGRIAYIFANRISQAAFQYVVKFERG